MDAKELRRTAMLCERLANGAVPFAVSLELLELADEFEAEAVARMFNDDVARRLATAKSGH